MINPDYPHLKPYEMVRTLDGDLMEVISYPYPDESGDTLVKVRQKDEPDTMFTVNANEVEKA